MKPFVATATAIALMLGAPALAATDDAETAAIEPSGDAAAGETVFGRQCATCHVVKDDEGELLAGRNGRQGPNLYNITGHHAAVVEDFKYGKSMAEVADTDTIWTEENFVAYVKDPTDWLRETLDDKKARSKMAWKVRDDKDAADVFAYLHSLSPGDAE
ncbi:cytochrome C [Pelagivirga sediminicola]|uniref:Cytochrome C n=1 Tax=Pelagivirga sediminicola TaxID=2170575 RepID=A0A2T7GBF3_9RHOB|nr:c-type cytochrome [Pelagivirga sediminicola]PVA11743.1 cytochrome C [Pelagivirga sediminicola]